MNDGKKTAAIPFALWMLEENEAIKILWLPLHGTRRESEREIGFYLTPSWLSSLFFCSSIFALVWFQLIQSSAVYSISFDLIFIQLALLVSFWERTSLCLNVENHYITEQTEVFSSLSCWIYFDFDYKNNRLKYTNNVI